MFIPLQREYIISNARIYLRKRKVSGDKAVLSVTEGMGTNSLFALLHNINLSQPSGFFTYHQV
jgi:hypothetical protein